MPAYGSGSLILFLCGRPYVCVCVCLCACVYVSAPRLLIISGRILTPYDWLNKFYSFYMAAIVGILSRRGLTIEVHRRNQLKKGKLVLCKP